MRLNLGIRRRLAPLLGNDRRKIELANSLLFTLPGSPIIYYGDEIGMGDDIWLPDRNGVRTPMQWENALNAGFSSAQPASLFAPVITNEPYSPQQINVADQVADPGSLWHTLRRMIALRKAQHAFGWGSFAWADVGADSVAAYWREDGPQRLLILNNLSASIQPVSLALPDGLGPDPTDLITNRRLALAASSKLDLELGPFEYCWLLFDSLPHKD
jgi:maltose alpha-D-glucosyltransferase/alpha-amylase